MLRGWLAKALGKDICMPGTGQSSPKHTTVWNLQLYVTCNKRAHMCCTLWIALGFAFHHLQQDLRIPCPSFN